MMGGDPGVSLYPMGPQSYGQVLYPHYAGYAPNYMIQPPPSYAGYQHINERPYLECKYFLQKPQIFASPSCLSLR